MKIVIAGDTDDTLNTPLEITNMKKRLTMNDFVTIVPWENIEFTMGKRDYKKFSKWMNGQTCSYNGVYPYDLERFLKGLPVID